MRDLPAVSQPGDQHQEPGHQMSVNHGAEGPRATTNGRRPSLPGTPPPARPIPCHPNTECPTAPPRPHRAGVDSGFQPLPLRKQLVSQTSLDSTGSSASRPHSPWGRFDPYDSPEVCSACFYLCVSLLCVCYYLSVPKMTVMMFAL